MVTSLRRKKVLEKYHRYLKNKKDGCPLCDKAELKKFKYWKIMKNDFPYGKIAKKHHMLVPVRHIKEDVLNKKELSELRTIKNGFLKDSNYDYILEATYSNKTIPDHFHLHLIVLK